MGSQSHAPRPHLKGQRREAGEKPRHKTTKATPRPGAHEGKRARWTPSARSLPRQPPQPRQVPCRGNMPDAGEQATLEPTGSNPTNYIGTKAREAPLWWHANLCQDHKHVRSDEDQKTATLGRILAEEIHKTPGKTTMPQQDLSWAPGKTLAEGISRATARPAPAKTPPPSPSSC